MGQVQYPKKDEALYPDGSGAVASLLEVVLIGFAYIAIAHAFLQVTDLSRHMPSFLSDRERTIGSGFLAGVTIQIGLVIIIAVFRSDMRRAILSTFKLGTMAAWGAALIACFIHATTAVLFFTEDPSLVIEPSARNAFLSAVPSLDGWTQEVMFRGYVIYRLARGGVPGKTQILLSALLFGAIHFGYAGDDFLSAFWPIFGTTVLGGFLAWSVRLGNGALLPVIVCHAVLIMVTQPWLALSS